MWWAKCGSSVTICGTLKDRRRQGLCLKAPKSYRVLWLIINFLSVAIYWVPMPQIWANSILLLLLGRINIPLCLIISHNYCPHYGFFNAHLGSDKSLNFLNIGGISIFCSFPQAFVVSIPINCAIDWASNQAMRDARFPAFVVDAVEVVWNTNWYDYDRAW